MVADSSFAIPHALANVMRITFKLSVLSQISTWFHQLPAPKLARRPWLTPTITQRWILAFLAESIELGTNLRRNGIHVPAPATPEEEISTRPRSKNRGLVVLLITASIAVVTGVVAIFTYLIVEVNTVRAENNALKSETSPNAASSKKPNTPTPSNSETATPTPSASPSESTATTSPDEDFDWAIDARRPTPSGPTEAELLDQAMESDDPAWETLESGRLYMRWADDTEIECGYYRCAGVVLYAVDSCPSGAYVRASIIVDDVVVGWTNDKTGGFGPDEVAIATLEDYNDYSGEVYFRVTEAHCSRW